MGREVRQAKARRAVLARHRGEDDPATIEARRDLKEAVVSQYIREVVDSFPPLTQEQRDELSLILRGPSHNGGGDA